MGLILINTLILSYLFESRFRLLFLLKCSGFSFRTGFASAWVLLFLNGAGSSCSELKAVEALDVLKPVKVERLLFSLQALFFVVRGLNEKIIDWSSLKSLGYSWEALNPMDMLARELQEECVREVLALLRVLNLESRRELGEFLATEIVGVLGVLIQS